MKVNRSRSGGSKRKGPGEPLVPPDQVNWRAYLPIVIAFFGVFLYAYWPTLTWVEGEWRNEPDYSHGYLVPFLAALLCYHRWDTFPGIRPRPSWAGLSLIALAIAMRLAGALLFAPPIDAWSMLPLIAGAVWVLFGIRTLRWAAPAIIFLLLMIPLPWRYETMLSWRLQGVASEVSTVFLRVLGQPAVNEGHTIWLGDQQLMVEQACSGLRIFMGVAALAFFWAAMVKRSWIDRLVIFALVIPVAIFVNAVRITTVGLLYQAFSGEESHRMIHDISGYLMIPFAFVLLWLLKIYWEHLYRPVSQLTAKDMVKKPSVNKPSVAT